MNYSTVAFNLSIILLIGTIGCASSPAPSKSLHSPEYADTVMSFELQAPKESNHMTYLGLVEDKPFTASQVDADWVIVEIFSMYCPHCQRAAPEMNRLFDKLNSDPRTRDHIKLIGIGVGNSAYEVGYFKDAYKIEFPIFADPKNELLNNLDGVRTPYYVIAKIPGKNRFKVYYDQVGGMNNANQFFELVLKKTGLL
jgi:peroxiredoxin